MNSSSHGATPESRFTGPRSHEGKNVKTSKRQNRSTIDNGQSTIAPPLAEPSTITMSFLTPWTIAIAAGLTLPPLIALYFLKLKRNVRLVPSTLLWKKAIEDLHVNSPFQRLRSSLLLFLQLLLLLLGALALGKPMWETAAIHEDALILLVDQSASMAVVESDGKTRLQRAKEEAKKCVDNLADNAQAMIIAFADQAKMVASFDSDKNALHRKIDAIEQTQARTTLGEAISLAETYAQTMIIGGVQVGSDIRMDPSSPPAKVFLFTDGRIEDLDRVAVERFDVNQITVKNVGERKDNLGITAMDARRNYDQPEFLEVAATVVNFGDQARDVDAVLYVGGRNVDVQTVHLPAAEPDQAGLLTDALSAAAKNVATVAFDNIEFTGSGVVQVVLQVEDALPADDRAWTVIGEPRRMNVLLVESGAGGLLTLHDSLTALGADVERMSGTEYEAASDTKLLEGRRSAFDVVILDRHSTRRLPPGNYFFWGAVPEIEGVSSSGTIKDQVIFNWDETHPILRYVGVETVQVGEWLDLKLPREAESLIDGETSSVLALLTRGSSQYLICAFGLFTTSQNGRIVENTAWPYSNPDFLIFLQNGLGYLSSNLSSSSERSLKPGEPASVPIHPESGEAVVVRPDGTEDRVATAGHDVLHYGRTQQVGTYRVKEGLAGEDVFAVNLFNEVESRIEPARTLTFGAEAVKSQAGSVEVNRPAWHYLLIGLLLVLLLEWVVYNQRVFV